MLRPERTPSLVHAGVRPARRSLTWVLLPLALGSCDPLSRSAPSRPSPGPPSPSTRVVASTPSGSVSDVETPGAPEPPPDPVLAGVRPIVRLAVPGFDDSIVSLPLGTRVRRPIVLAAHGNYDRPEWQCAVWRATLDKARVQAFVLCPRGVARDDSPSADDIRFTYRNAASLFKELDAGLAELRARYAEFVFPENDGPVVYTGFSLGAIAGVSYILRNPARTPRAVFTEGSQGQWTPTAVRAYAKGGGLRVLFACGQPSCATMSNGIAAVMKKVGLDSRVVHGKGIGHGYDGAVADEIAAQLPWLLEGDPRWAP